MATTDVDRLSDLANTASYLAERSDRLEDHGDAAKAHYAAYKAAKASQKESRPSLGENHLRRATEHDKIATEPDSYAQKKVLARVAGRKADSSPGVATFRAASKAHKEAAAAYRKENPASGKGVTAESMPWELRDHERNAQQYSDQADFLEKKEATDDGVAEKLSKKPEGALPAKSTDEKPGSAPV